MFIVFEGIDGVGKSVISEMVFKYLNKDDRVYKKFFPTESRYGQFVKEAIKLNYNDKIIASQLILDFKDSMPKIDSLLKNGCTIIADRYIYSFKAYQKVILGKEIMNSELKNIGNIIKPDIIFVLHADRSVIEKRIANRKKDKCNIENKGMDFLMEVQEEYKTMKTKNKFKIDVSNLGINEVFEKVIAKIKAKKRGKPLSYIRQL